MRRILTCEELSMERRFCIRSVSGLLGIGGGRARFVVEWESFMDRCCNRPSSVFGPPTLDIGCGCTRLGLVSDGPALQPLKDPTFIEDAGDDAGGGATVVSFDRLSQNFANRLPFPALCGAGDVEDPGESVLSEAYCEGLVPDVFDPNDAEGVGVNFPFEKDFETSWFTGDCDTAAKRWKLYSASRPATLRGDCVSRMTR